MSDTSGASSFEALFNGRYIDVLSFQKILESIHKLWKDEKEKSGLIEKIVEDKKILEDICTKINESKGNVTDVLFDPEFTLQRAIDEAFGPNSKEGEQLAYILNAYDLIEVTDNTKANAFSNKLMGLGVPHTSFTIYKPVLNEDGKPKYRTDGVMETIPTTVLLTNHTFLKLYDKDRDYQNLLKTAVRVSKVGFNKEERFGFIPEKEFIRTTSDVVNVRIEIPEKNFNMVEFNSKMAMANKKYTTKKSNGKEYIFIPFNDRGFAEAMMQEVVLETKSTILGQFALLEAQASTLKLNDLANEINQLQSNKTEDECIYIFNGSDTNDKSYIEIPKNGNAVMYTYRPNDKENPFVKETNEVLFKGDSYEFAQDIFREGGSITKGLRQGITVYRGPKIVDEKGVNKHDEIISKLQPIYDKSSAITIDTSDAEIINVINKSQDYINNINAILNLTNNDNRAMLNDSLNNLLVNQALIKIVNAFKDDPEKTAKILKTANKKSISIGGKTFDLDSLVDGKSLNVLKSEERNIIDYVVSTFDEKEQKKVKDTLSNAFNVSFQDKELEILANDKPATVSDLEISLNVVKCLTESAKDIEKIEVKDVASTLDKEIESMAERAFEMDEKGEKADPTR